jgi:hypothetical protein
MEYCTITQQEYNLIKDVNGFEAIEKDGEYIVTSNVLIIFGDTDEFKLINFQTKEWNNINTLVL